MEAARRAEQQTVKLVSTLFHTDGRYRPNSGLLEYTTVAAPRHTVGILTESMNCVGAEVVATVLAPGVHRRGEVCERADLLNVARHAIHGTVYGIRYTEI